MLLNKIPTNLFYQNVIKAKNNNLQQFRSKYVNRWMIRDVKRRKLATEMAVDRLRVNSLRRNDILPPELREIADVEIAAFPRDSCLSRQVNRCVITSKSKGNVDRWRISRFIFRHLSDYNKLAGMLRARW